MFAFYMSLEKLSGSHTKNTFSIWRSHNHNVRMNLNGNKLANLLNFLYKTFTQPRFITIIQNYMRLERNIHKQEQPSTLGHWL